MGEKGDKISGLCFSQNIKCKKIIKKLTKQNKCNRCHSWGKKYKKHLKNTTNSHLMLG
jgi:hypothetical protein